MPGRRDRPVGDQVRDWIRESDSAAISPAGGDSRMRPLPLWRTFVTLRLGRAAMWRLTLTLAEWRWPACCHRA